MSDYTIKKLDSNQFDILIPLMKNCFGMEVNTAYFKWKFLDNPAGEFTGFIAVKTDTNEVAAYYGVIPERYIIDGKEKIIYQSCDTMTHSNHRRKGLFQMLATHCYDYLRANDTLFVIGFGGPTSTPGLLKCGWRKVFDFQILFIPNALCYSSYFAKNDDENCQVISDLEMLNDLLESKDITEIHSFRNLEHLAWRYGNPLNSYQLLAFNGVLGIEGFVCYYTQNNKIFLFDFAFATKNSRQALINNLKRKVMKEKLKGIVAFCQEKSDSMNELRQSGFISNPFSKGPLNEKTPFMFYADEETMNNFAKPSCWFINSYDHDAL